MKKEIRDDSNAIGDTAPVVPAGLKLKEQALSGDPMARVTGFLYLFL